MELGNSEEKLHSLLLDVYEGAVGKYRGALQGDTYGTKEDHINSLFAKLREKWIAREIQSHVNVLGLLTTIARNHVISLMRRGAREKMLSCVLDKEDVIDLGISEYIGAPEDYQALLGLADQEFNGIERSVFRLQYLCDLDYKTADDRKFATDLLGITTNNLRVCKSRIRTHLKTLPAQGFDISSIAYAGSPNTRMHSCIDEWQCEWENANSGSKIASQTGSVLFALRNELLPESELLHTSAEDGWMYSVLQRLQQAIVVCKLILSSEKSKLCMPVMTVAAIATHYKGMRAMDWSGYRGEMPNGTQLVANEFTAAEYERGLQHMSVAEKATAAHLLMSAVNTYPVAYGLHEFRGAEVGLGRGKVGTEKQSVILASQKISVNVSLHAARHYMAMEHWGTAAYLLFEPLILSVCQHYKLGYAQVGESMQITRPLIDNFVTLRNAYGAGIPDPFQHNVAFVDQLCLWQVEHSY